MHPRITVLRMAAVALAIAWGLASAGASVPTLLFSQLDINLDGAVYQDSEWGAIDLDYTGYSQVMYFNVAVNGNWCVQNMPLLSREGLGVSTSAFYTFNLGFPRGQDVPSLSYDYAITSDVQPVMPSGSQYAAVGPATVNLSGGFRDTVMGLLAVAPALRVGGAVVAGTAHKHSGFPNQECGSMECVPAAVSNSLQFLNKKKNLHMDPNSITIAKMKVATKWEATGCWTRPDPNRPAGQRNAWWQDKNLYMQDPNHPLPITTRQIDFENATEAQRRDRLEELGREMDANQDIEFNMPGHTAALIEIVKHVDGKYKLTIAHDIKQGQAGGTKEEELAYDPATNRFTGVFGTNSEFLYAVIECPEPTTLVLLALGSLALFRSRSA